MSIKSYIDELEQINAEIKRNNMRNRSLRQRSAELESNIALYLAEKDQQGLKYKGRAIIIENKETRPVMKKKEKEQNIISLLEEWGLTDTSKAYSKLQDVQRGDPIKKKKIKFTKLPNF